MIKQLVFEKVSISRKGVELIQPFSAKISCGNFVILTGANGTGKSTFLKTLVGILETVKGDILLDGQSINRLKNGQRSRIFAYLNSKKIEEDYIRIIDLITLGRYPYQKVSDSKIKGDELILEYVEAMGLAPIQHKFLNEVSDGELQKAAIARALVQDTPVIIMDEPTAFLDYPSKKHLFSLLRNLAIEKNKIIICATHDVEMAAVHGTSFWHLENRLLQFSDRTIGW